MNLTSHFSLEELLVTQHRSIDNTPPDWVKENLQVLANSLELVRQRLGFPMLITSGYRSPALNQAVGGSSTSKHMQGLAADFICPGFGTPFDVCKALAESDLKFDQIIYERTWIHWGLAMSTNTPRRQVLSLTRSGTFIKGLVNVV